MLSVHFALNTQWKQTNTLSSDGLQGGGGTTSSFPKPKFSLERGEDLVQTIQRQKSGSKEASLLAERQFLVQGRCFDKCRLKKANLFGGSFVQCSFRNSDLSNTSFGFATLTNSVFTNANLLGCSFPLGEYKTTELAAIRNGDTLEPIKQCGGFPKACVSPDGKIIAHSQNTQIKLAWYPDGHVHSWNAHRFEISELSFSPDSKLLASSSFDVTVRLWDTSDNSLRFEYSFGHAVYSAVFSPVLPVVACCGIRKEIRLWNPEDNSVIELHGHTLMVEKLAYSASGTMLASASSDLTIIVWDLTDNTVYRRLAKQPDPKIVHDRWSRDIRTAKAFFFAKADTQLVCQYKNSSFSVWDIRKQSIIFELASEPCEILQSFPALDIFCLRSDTSCVVHRLDWFLDSVNLNVPVKNLRMMALGQEETCVFSHNLALWVQVENKHPVQLHADDNWTVSMSAGYAVLYSPQKGEVNVYTFDGDLVMTYEGGHNVIDARCIPGDLLLVSTYSSTVVIIDLKTAKTVNICPLRLLETHIPIGVSKSGQVIQARVTCNTVVLMDSSEVSEPSDIDEKITTAVLSPDQKFFAYANRFLLTIVQLETQLQFKASEPSLKGLNFSENSKYLIVISPSTAKVLKLKLLFKG